MKKTIAIAGALIGLIVLGSSDVVAQAERAHSFWKVKWIPIVAPAPAGTETMLYVDRDDGNKLKLIENGALRGGVVTQSDVGSTVSCRSTRAQASSTTLINVGLAVVHGVGSQVGVALSDSVTGAVPRLQSTSATGANATSQMRTSLSGGVLVTPRFSSLEHRMVLSTLVAGQAVFIGAAATGTWTGTDPSGWANETIYVGCDAADDNLSVCSNDGTSTATCTTLGASFPCTVSAPTGYLVRFTPSGSGVDYYVEQAGGSSTSGTLTTDLPASGTGMQMLVGCSAAGTGVACVQQWSHTQICEQW